VKIIVIFFVCFIIKGGNIMQHRMIKESLEGIIFAYEKLMRGIDADATDSETNRSYGGIVRAGKGELVESMVRALVETAWVHNLNQSKNRLKMDKKKIKVSMKSDYINKISDPDVQYYLINHHKEQFYNFGTDVHVFIDDKLILPIECKAYTENAMLKRIVFDANLAFEYMKIESYLLFQLESQLGGDYNEIKPKTFGSPSTNTILSYSRGKIDIITLLEGERKVNKPIHKSEFYKPIKYKNLELVLYKLSSYLKKYI
jgi:hypothetical protein